MGFDENEVQLSAGGQAAASHVARVPVDLRTHQDHVQVIPGGKRYLGHARGEYLIRAGRWGAWPGWGR